MLIIFYIFFYLRKARKTRIFAKRSTNIFYYSIKDAGDGENCYFSEIIDDE